MIKEVRNLGVILGIVLVICYGVYKFALSTGEKKMIVPAIQQVPMVSNLVANHSFSSGPADAKVTVVEFFDPECESCAAVAPIIKNEMKYYEGKVRWVFRYMAYHQNSKAAVKVLEAARKQNLFLEVKDTLFEKQKIWGERQGSMENEILKIVSQIKSLDINKLKKDMNDPSILDVISKDKIEGEKSGVHGTPTFFVNGILIEELDMDLLIKKINERL